MMISTSRRRSSQTFVTNDFIRNIPIFSTCDPHFVNWIINHAEVKMFTQDEVIIYEGEAGETLFIINRGDVEVIVNGSDGKQIVVTTLSDGRFFGEISVLGLQKKCMATVKAKSFCDIRCVQGGLFLALLQRFPSERANLEAEAQRRIFETRRLVIGGSQPSGSTLNGRTSAMNGKQQRFSILEDAAGVEGTQDPKKIVEPQKWSVVDGESEDALGQKHGSIAPSSDSKLQETEAEAITKEPEFLALWRRGSSLKSLSPSLDTKKRTTAWKSRNTRRLQNSEIATRNTLSEKVGDHLPGRKQNKNEATDEGILGRGKSPRPTETHARFTSMDFDSGEGKGLLTEADEMEYYCSSMVDDESDADERRTVLKNGKLPIRRLQCSLRPLTATRRNFPSVPNPMAIAVFQPGHLQPAIPEKKSVGMLPCFDSHALTHWGIGPGSSLEITESKSQHIKKSNRHHAFRHTPPKKRYAGLYSMKSKNSETNPIDSARGFPGATYSSPIDVQTSRKPMTKFSNCSHPAPNYLIRQFMILVEATGRPHRSIAHGMSRFGCKPPDADTISDATGVVSIVN